MIQARYQLTLADYQEAWQPHFAKRRGRLPLWIVAVFAFVMAVLMLARQDLFGPLFSGWISGFFTTMGTLLLSASYLQRRNVATIWTGNPFLARPQTATATQDAFQLQTEYSHSHISWRGYTRWAETKNLFLLYLSEPTFHIVPKRAFANEEQLNDFRALLSNISRQAPSVPPIPEPQ
jgi:hypothetical protein